jgi:hypothetical protein
MGDIQQVTVYYRSAYVIAALIYGSYIVVLSIRARRALTRLQAAKRES